MLNTDTQNWVTRNGFRTFSWLVVAVGMAVGLSLGCTKKPPLAASPPVADTPGYFLPSFYWSKAKYDVSPGTKSAAEHPHEREHVSHSAALTEFEEKECRLFPPSVRATCPLLGHVRKTVDVKDGVMIYFLPKMSTEAVLAHMRCHHAFAQSQKFDNGKSCALYVQGVQIKKAGDKRGVMIWSDDPDVVKEIRRRLRLHTE